MAAVQTLTSTRTFTRTALIKTQFRFLIAETINPSQEYMKKFIDDGIDEKWLGEVMVYAIDSTNKCLGQINLQIDWDKHKQEMVVNEKVVLHKPWSGKNNDISNGVSAIVSTFMDFAESNELRLIWHYRYAPGVDSAAMNKKLGTKDAQLPQWKESPGGGNYALSKLRELAVGAYYAGQ
jgi:hypothetical protein